MWLLYKEQKTAQRPTFNHINRSYVYTLLQNMNHGSSTNIICSPPIGDSTEDSHTRLEWGTVRHPASELNSELRNAALNFNPTTAKANLLLH